jgi:DNA-directed RNA polymerase subunit RPC12/RpoP
MQQASECSEEYKRDIVPQVNRWGIKVILIFLGFLPFGVVIEAFVNYISLPSKSTIVFLFGYGLLYLKQIYSINNISCPNCNQPLFIKGKAQISFNSHLSKRCSHCGVKLR